MVSFPRMYSLTGSGSAGRKSPSCRASRTQPRRCRKSCGCRTHHPSWRWVRCNGGKPRKKLKYVTIRSLSNARWFAKPRKSLAMRKLRYWFDYLSGDANQNLPQEMINRFSRKKLSKPGILKTLTLTSDMAPAPPLAAPVTADSRLKFPDEDRNPSRPCWWP